MEELKNNQKKSNNSLKLIILCWLVYTCSYIGKFSYNANIEQFIKVFSVSKKSAGTVSSFFFFVYGAGQIINGLLCKKYNVKYTIFISLLVASIVNLLLVFVPKFSLIKYLWLINGAAMSFLWTSLIRLLSETLNKNEINSAIVAMGTTVATGTCIVYALSALFVGILNYKWTFYFASAIIFIVSIVWIFSFSKIVIPLKKQVDKIETNNIIENNTSKKNYNGLITLICVLAFFAVANNFTKDGLTTWTPKILSEIYKTPSWLSILLTILLPILAIGGTIVAVFLFKKIKNFVGVCCTLFSISSILILIIIACLSSSLLFITICFFAIISCLMAGVNNVITSMVPLHLKDKVNSGKLAGILNGFCYLGSTLSSFGLGAIADKFGWKIVLYVLLTIAIIVTIIGSCYLLFNKIKKGGKSENVSF